SSLAELFARAAALAPEQTAIAFGEVELTYAELAARTSRLARFLARQGVAAGDLVGLFLERSAETVVAMLAILKAGAAYLPLDPSYPAERLALMLEDSGAALLLTDGGLATRLPAVRARGIRLDEVGEEIAGESDAPIT